MATLCPVIIRGKRFPSQAAAARHFNLKPVAISTALWRRGDCETVGLPRSVYLRGKGSGPSVKTTIFGVTFRSRTAAALALGVRRQAVYEVASGTAKRQTREIVYAALLRWQAAGGKVAE